MIVEVFDWLVGSVLRLVGEAGRARLGEEQMVSKVLSLAAEEVEARRVQLGQMHYGLLVQLMMARGHSLVVLLVGEERALEVLDHCTGTGHSPRHLLMRCV